MRKEQNGTFRRESKIYIWNLKFNGWVTEPTGTITIEWIYWKWDMEKLNRTVEKYR